MEEDFSDLDFGAESFYKTNMMNAGRLIDKQHSRKDVLYYIFRGEAPVYVGVTNNFKRRYAEHFSKYRAKDERYKRLYTDMNKNGFEKYAMHIVTQSHDKEYVDELEIFHISELRRFGLAELNVANGGRGLGSKYDVSKFAFDDFLSNFKEIEDECISVTFGAYSEFYEVDLDKMKMMFEKYLDFHSLKSSSSCLEYGIYNQYDEYVKNTIEKNKKLKTKKEIYDIEEFISLNIFDIGTSIPPCLFFSNVLNKSAMRSDIKERSIAKFFDVIDYISDCEDIMEKYVGLKLLIGKEYERDIEELVIHSGYGLSDYSHVIRMVTGANYADFEYMEDLYENWCV